MKWDWKRADSNVGRKPGETNILVSKWRDVTRGGKDLRTKLNSEFTNMEITCDLGSLLFFTEHSFCPNAGTIQWC